jgi:hypothetical protein
MSPGGSWLSSFPLICQFGMRAGGEGPIGPRSIPLSLLMFPGKNQHGEFSRQEGAGIEDSLHSLGCLS